MNEYGTINKAKDLGLSLGDQGKVDLVQIPNLEEKKLFKSNDLLFIKKGRSFIKLKVENIILIQVDGRYCKIISLTKKFLVGLSLRKIHSMLPDNLFQQTHRNFIVNVKRVNEICPEDNLITLENGHHAILSERFKGNFIKRFFVLR